METIGPSRVAEEYNLFGYCSSFDACPFLEGRAALPLSNSSGSKIPIIKTVVKNSFQDQNAEKEGNVYESGCR